MDDPTDAIGKEYNSVNEVPESVIEHDGLAIVEQYNGNVKVITEDQWEGKSGT